MSEHSKIEWTEATWNPLQGCVWVSAGCDRCYAAKLIATRMADLYPGLARDKGAEASTKSYIFLNKIVLLPEDLGHDALGGGVDQGKAPGGAQA